MKLKIVAKGITESTVNVMTFQFDNVIEIEIDGVKINITKEATRQERAVDALVAYRDKKRAEQEIPEPRFTHEPLHKDILKVLMLKSPQNQTEIINALSEVYSVNSITKVLHEQSGKLWNYVKGARGAKFYSII
jgi:hypothetical protein